MRDLKTYLSVAPVVSTLWFGALASLLIEINRFFSGCIDIPLFLIIVTVAGSGEEDSKSKKYQEFLLFFF